MLKNKYFIGCLLLATVFSSCSKSDSYDIQGDPEVKFFTNNTSAGNAPQNAISYSVVNIPNVSASGLQNLSTTMPATIKIPVYASKPVGQDVTIGAQLDNSLIARYNAANNTDYAAFPAGILTTDGLLARIVKGTSTSTDSISITTNLAALNTLTGTLYMAPIKLTTVSSPEAGGITTNTTTQVTYIVANVEQRRIKYLAVAADALGTLITPRTPWAINFTPAPTTVGNVLDGLTTTFSRWVASPVQVDVNLQTTQNVTGIRLFTATSATYVPTKVDVYLSNDGINYDLIGSPLKANLTYASSYNYILFYKAIPAKYIRVILYYVTNTNTQNYRLVEFDTYAN
jgi:hypothetical protein